LFTGIIEEVGTIRRISKSADGAGLVIGAGEVLSDLKVGDSIAVSGPCLTVTALERNGFTAWAMPETLKKTTLNTAGAGDRINLERALALGGRLGGHLVSGHIDAVVTVGRRSLEGGAILLYFETPGHLLRYIIPKGSVALDGVSLTVIDLDSSGFSVGLIPHTAGQTTLGQKEPGEAVNLEVDLIGKYVEKILQPYRGENAKQKKSITMSLLQEKGYL